MFLAGCGADVWGSRDFTTPPPLVGQIPLDLAAVTPGTDRDNDAAAFVLGYVSDPLRVRDTRINISAITRTEFLPIWTSRGNEAAALSRHNWGYFLVARPDLEQLPTLYTFSDAGGDRQEQRFRALHEWGHVIWHYLVTDQEWSQWAIAWYAYSDSSLDHVEGWANAVADHSLGKRIAGRPEVGAAFRRIVSSIGARGSPLLRG